MAPNEHDMRIYWEYLSFLFRRIPALEDQELIEWSYRDKLQVPSPLDYELLSCMFNLDCLDISHAAEMMTFP